MNLTDQLQHIVESLTLEDGITKDFVTRIKKGKLVRAEDPLSHFCVYFVPFITTEKKVFLGHHTKANSWIAPGGHIEIEHTSPLETVVQEAREELGSIVNKTQISKPFFISVQDVFSPKRACRKHYSVWYALLFFQEESFVIEKREFYAARWMNMQEAKEKVVQKENLDALAILSSW